MKSFSNLQGTLPFSTALGLVDLAQCITRDMIGDGLKPCGLRSHSSSSENFNRAATAQGPGSSRRAQTNYRLVLLQLPTLRRYQETCTCREPGAPRQSRAPLHTVHVPGNTRQNRDDQYWRRGLLDRGSPGVQWPAHYHLSSTAKQRLVRRPDVV